MCTSLQIGARGLQRLMCSKYYNVEKWKRRFTCGLDAVKNSHYIQKWF